MLSSSPARTEEASSDLQKRLRLGERMIAEQETRKRDTSVLGAQLQEVFVRNEKLQEAIE